MEIGTLAENILSIYYGGDLTDENGIQKEDVIFLMAAAANAMVPIDYFKRRIEEGRLVNGLFISTFESVPIEYNEKRDRHYIDLPARPIQLFHGVDLDIAPMKGEDASFIPLPPGFINRASGTPLAELEGNVAYNREGTRVYLYNFDALKKVFMKEVLVRQVVDIYSLGEDDELPVPGDYIQQITDYIFSKLPKRGNIPDTINENVTT